VQFENDKVFAKLLVILAGSAFLLSQAGKGQPAVEEETCTTASSPAQEAVKEASTKDASVKEPPVEVIMEIPAVVGAGRFVNPAAVAGAYSADTDINISADAGADESLQDCLSTPLKVLIQSDGYSGYYHQEIVVGTDASKQYWTASENEADESLVAVLCPEDFGTDALTVYSITRSQGHPSYHGKLEIYSTPQGLVLVNEIEMEEYLRGVLPSEMPSSYPMEALKSQAVCARTYALYRQWNRKRNPDGVHPVWAYADVDDSVSFQVYNNVQPQPQCDEAIAATAGEILVKEGDAPAEIYYYSTSATDEIEQEMSFYRWEYVNGAMDAQRLANRINLCGQENPGSVVGVTSIANPAECRVLNIRVTGMRGDGRVERLAIDTNEGTAEVVGEYYIRQVLCDGVSEVVLQDGAQIRMERLLPSAFFTIETIQDGKFVIGYKVRGGGFGHGDGLSQNGALALAEKGYSYTDILIYYFKDCNMEKTGYVEEAVEYREGF